MLDFAKQTEYVVQDDTDTLDEYDKKEVTTLHHRNKVEIRLCACNRCVNFKYRKKLENFLNSFNRPPNTEENKALWEEIGEETNRQRLAEQRRGNWQ